jgi:hypothetical protein
MNNSSNTSNVNTILVSRAPLSLNDPLNLVRVSVSGNAIWTDDATGKATTNTVIVQGRPTILEWSKSGTELYYATDANNVYRVSHITEISDNSPVSYNGKFFTEIFKYNQSSPHAPNFSTLNPASPYRTTLIGSFDKPVTSISVAQNDSVMVLTFNNPAMTGSTGIVMMSTNSVKKSNSTNIGWVNKDATFPPLTTYCSLMEKGDFKKVFVGTENGIYYTNDITQGSVVWDNVNAGITVEQDKLPNVQVFDIKQQTLEPWDCYNSGQIYVATNGRGVWNNNMFIRPYVVGTEEYTTGRVAADESHLNLFPNPASGQVSIAFNSIEGENAMVQIMDLSGRVVSAENLGKLDSGEYTHTISTSELNTGVYIVNVSSNSGVKRIAKLVVSK